MEISEYENIEIFNKTQSFDVNKCENQILRQPTQVMVEWDWVNMFLISVC